MQGAGSAPMRGYSDGVVTVVTNGDQTDTVYEAFQQGRTFEEALRTRTFEPDPPKIRVSQVPASTSIYRTKSETVLSRQGRRLECR